MRTALQMRLGLTLTPQLQQAIRLLQLSTLDLQQEIQQTLETNPMLEVADEEINDDAIPEATGQQSEQLATSEMDLQYPDIPSELPVDASWAEIYSDHASFTGNKPTSTTEQPFDAHYSAKSNLHDHLLWQLQLSHLNESDYMVAIAIIDSINDDGLLTCTLDDILESVSTKENPVDVSQIEVVLHHIQSFEPTGVGARDVRECLSLQLRQLPMDTPALSLAEIIINQHLNLLAHRDFNQLMRVLNIRQEQLVTAIQLIQSLEPRPGSRFSAKDPGYIIPDVIVKKQAQRWLIELNGDLLPKLRINNHYANLIQRANTSADNVFLRNHLQEARWFIKSLQSRNETLLKVATCIVEQQLSFLEHGQEAMKPLILRDIADILGLHESTISRVTTQKYMLTPHGIFELKYFFSSHIGVAGSNTEYSGTAIRAFIKKLVAAENTERPLSDNDIAQLLHEQGIPVARRTVAKYRESMAIPPSHERRSIVMNES